MKESLFPSLFNSLPSGEGWGRASSLDIHTHVLAGPNSICSLPPFKAIELSRSVLNQPYSIELHPWYASQSLLEDFLKACEICKEDPRFVAIGECGLDSLAALGRNGLAPVPMEIQKDCFNHALAKARELEKPVILHIVKAWEELFKMVDDSFPPLIIHGFRKNATFAKQLISRGFYLSLGKNFDTNILKEIPEDRLFYETDTTAY